MGAARPLSPAARRRLHTGCLVWGSVLVVAWLVITVVVMGRYSPRVGLDAQATLWILLLPGVVLLPIGIRGALAAKRFNRLDSAFADALSETLDNLWRTDAFEAYRAGHDMAEVQGARLVEIERHFDQQTIGSVAGRMSHQLSFFGGTLSRSYGNLGVGGLAGAVNGLSRVDLTVHQTTRDNLMGDALFAVFEVPAGEQDWDTYRVVSVSAVTAAEWLRGLVLAAGGELEGPATHAGSTVLGWAPNLVAQFAPRDISYATDQLRAQAARAPEQRGVLTVRGPSIGRNAVLASHVQIGDRPPLLLFPTRFPVLFAQAVAVAAHRADGVVAAEPTSHALGPSAADPDAR